MLFPVLIANIFDFFFVSESMTLAKDETDDQVDESGSLEALPANKKRDKHGSAGVRSRWSQPVSKFGVASSKTSKHGKVRPTDVTAVPEAKQVRRAQKAMSSKVLGGSFASLLNILTR